MGRPYSTELAHLAVTYQWARCIEPSALPKSIDALRGRPLIVIGSGGSLSACTFVARLHETHARLPARVLTPFEFIRHPVPQAAGVLLLSAGGSNPDVLAAAKHAIAVEYSTIVGFCTRPNTKLKALLSEHRYTAIFEFVGPSKKDGFLATNSLLLTCTLLARAYRVELPESLPALEDPPRWPSAEDHAGQDFGTACTKPTDLLALGEALTRPHVLALADGWAVTAAVDLESRWAESGFGTVTVTDARNFAHGRHHGLSRRLADTLVLGLSVTDEGGAGRDDLVATTLARLPQSAAVSILRSPFGGEAGALDLLVRVIYLAGEAGRRLGLDPGRPQVPAFGRKLYHAALPRPLLRRAQEDGAHSAEDLWIRRKVTPVVWAAATEETRDSWRAQCRAWVSAAESTRVGGVVLDYDGTLCEACERFGNPDRAVGTALTGLIDAGMVVGVATGRGGRSVVRGLRAVVPERAWPEIIVGRCNGGIRSRLDEQVEDLPPMETLERANTILSASPVLAQVARFELKPTQLTIFPRPDQPLPKGLLCRFVIEALDAAKSPLAVDVLASDHSVDVIPRDVSKWTVVEEVRRALAQAGRPGLAVMTIGDQGQAGGNDAAFLAHPLGLSVEHTSSDFTSCWNVAPRGARRTAALLGYLNALRPLTDEDGFRWSVSQANRPLPTDRGRGGTTTVS